MGFRYAETGKAHVWAQDVLGFRLCFHLGTCSRVCEQRAVRGGLLCLPRLRVFESNSSV